MKLYNKYILCYLTFLAAGLVLLLAFYEPSVNRAWRAGEILLSGRNRMLRSGRLFLLCVDLLTLAFPIGLYMTIFHPLQETVVYSALCLSGAYNTRSPKTTTREFLELRNNLRTMSEKLYQSNDEQQIFLSNLSHDFRSPLTSIKGFTEAILDGTIEPHEQEKYLNIILDMTKRLTNLSTALVDLNRHTGHEQTLNLTDFDINELLFSVASSVELNCRKRDIRLVLNLASRLPMVCADEAKIQEVIMNLLDNAIKFSDTHQDLIIRSYYRLGKVYVSIRDFGVIIQKEEIPHIWTRFYKADHSRDIDRESSGIGLTIVKKYLSMHGQDITVSSSPESGTEFCFSLERAQYGEVHKKIFFRS